ncbi:succinylglutamate desuccinylase/aspartoacylase family protein [Halomicroarcula sp. F13]|uniref:Succinylglutamate desuccinylase/aspartoacylase family protein n=1 Tax=Haloarcula rubra TaxID=2487747 RepID=A0AAW4PTH1_9EURY|nr:succinylglutamate desuccinylase/aspartoacylase family protein [Halomicroarcula rubra]MBX0324486.1 succinylglutamate desuccinylase/aspartoacylase family protein [Halomicroarcula rubra]
MSDTVSPDVTVRGPDGDPEVTVVAGIHGDEPSGVRAIQRVLDAGHEFERPVQFVYANPPALAADRRYVDVDMNRAFPGDSDSEAQEQRLAAELLDVVGDTPTLSLHATHSQPEPMTLVSREYPTALETAAALPTPSVVDTSRNVDGTLNQFAPVVTVEAGRQRTEDATDTATMLVETFLRIHDVLPGAIPEGDPTFYELDDVVEKPDDAPPGAACKELYDLEAENFELVPEGTVWATIDGEQVLADEPFVPILMSECGYQDIFGYKGFVAGETLSDARTYWEMD